MLFKAFTVGVIRTILQRYNNELVAKDSSVYMYVTTETVWVLHDQSITKLDYGSDTAQWTKFTRFVIMAYIPLVH